jgi:NADPH2:quinone reductase
VLVLGFASGGIPAIPGNRLLLRNVGLLGVGLGALLPFVPEVLDEGAARLRPLLADGLRPLVGEVLPLADGADGLRRLEARAATGKIVLTMH